MSTQKAETAGEFFDRYADEWQSYYTQGSNAQAFDYHNRQRLALELVEKYVPKGASILEFGCGSGHTASQLASMGYKLSCLDVSQGMVDKARETFEQAGHEAEFFHGVLDDLPEGCGPFDAIMAFGVMDYIEDHPATLARIDELLTPGGICLLSFTNAGSPLRWVELPTKRFAAFIAWMATRDMKHRDVALKSSKGNHRRETVARYEKAGIQCEETAYFSYGIRFRNHWIPPLSIVKRLEGPLSGGTLRGMGRGFMVVGRKRPENS